MHQNVFNLLKDNWLSACPHHILHSFSLTFTLHVFFSRQQLLKATFDSPPISPKTPASAVKCKTPRERGQKCNSSVLSHFFQKRPKTSPTKDTQHSSSARRVQEGKIQTARTHNANDADLHSATAQLSVVVKEEPMDVEEASLVGLMSVKQEDAGLHGVSSGIETAHSSSPSKDIKPVIKGESLLPAISLNDALHLTGT